MKIALNIKARLTLWYLLIMVTVLAFFSGLAYYLLGSGLMQSDILPLHTRQFQIETENNGKGLIATVTGVSEQNWENRQDDLIWNMQLNSDQLSNLNESGTLVIPIPEGQLTLDANIIDPQNNNPKVQLNLYRSPDTPGSFELVITTQSITNINKQLQIFLRSLYITIPLTMVVAGVLWLLLVKKLLYPLEAITKATQEIQENNLDKRLPVRTNDELGRLANSLNKMFERLENSFDREKRFAADTSHELRTPLNIIRGEASLALRHERDNEEYRQLLEKITRQTDRMSALLQKLRFLEQDEGNIQMSLEEFDLIELLKEITVDLQTAVKDKGINLYIEADGDCRIKGDETLLHDLFGNLLDNAMKYTTTGGKINITAIKRDGTISVSIRDTGCGIPARDLPHIFDRFYRVNKKRDGGMGLGLAVCKRIVDLHGGRIEAESRMGEGSEFRVTFGMLLNSQVIISNQETITRQITSNK